MPAQLQLLQASIVPIDHHAGWGASPLAIGFTIFIYFIEVLVAFIQAFIFAMLTAVFIGQAREGEHHHDDKHTAADYDDAVMV